MLKYTWVSTTITTNKEANSAMAQFDLLAPQIAAFDTETTGLHIINDKPFIFQFGFLNPQIKEGYTYVVDIEQQPNLAGAVIRAWHKRVKQCKLYLGHNVKFDLNMLINIGLPYKENNISDTMFYIRYAHDALQADQGGPPLGLKEYASQYIDPNAKIHEQLLEAEKSMIAKNLNNLLKVRLKKCGMPPPEYNAKSYTLGVIGEMFKDATFEVDSLPFDVREIYQLWLNEDVPEYIRDKMQEALVAKDAIPYSKLNRENLIRYAHYDIVYTLETYLATASVLKARHNEKGVEFERENIYPLLSMERVGFKADVAYLEAARVNVKQYILSCRDAIWRSVGVCFKTGQHEFIKKLLINKFHLSITATNDNELSLVKNKLKRANENPEASQFIDRLQELRTLEKWYSAYILRFQKNLKNNDRLYTQINQVGAISGRVTSDFQQFPKEAILDSNGNELFHPRKIVLAEKGLVYLDYSQIELRFQAIYTILVGHPDLNLCRAYMPYKCIDEHGVLFNYKNIEHIKRWNDVWFYEEDKNKRWVPTDVHGATTTYATGLTPDDPTFKHARTTIGKRTNFAKNYGAQYMKICEMFPDKTPAECKRIDEAYYKAFPGVREYHHYCYELAKCSSYAENLFGIRYYNATGHKLINLLVQGSAAYFLKKKIKETSDYLHNNNCKSRFQMNIHDEMSFVYDPEDSVQIFFDIQNIMQNWEDTLIPIVADMEVTKTNWSEKVDVESPEQLQIYLSA